MGEECGSTLNGIVAECPEVTITVMGTDVKCIIDTGAQVSTLTEAFYNQHLRSMVDLNDISDILRINTSQGAELPFIRFTSLQATLMGTTFTVLGCYWE